MSSYGTRAGQATSATDLIVAGVIGAVGTDAFISIAHHVSPVSVWQFIASAALGAIAYDAPQYSAVGLVLHVVIALVWAYLYVVVWGRLSSLRNWVLGGIVWGIVVTACMDALEAVRGILGPLTPSSVTFGLITNVVFFGLLVAWYLSRRARA